MRKYALLSVGELLVDVIGQEIADSLLDTASFNRLQGGSPANLAANMTRLGAQVALVACVGNDNLGVFVKNEIAKIGLETHRIASDDIQPTSLVIVSKTRSTPDFIPYRCADRMLKPEHLPDELLAESEFLHTTCWPLSMQPAQSTVLDAARRASRLGCRLSVDANYAPSVWPNRAEAWAVLSEYCSYGAYIKLSEDDAYRLYNQEIDNETIIANFHKMGASLVCLTLGGKGSIVSAKGGQERVEIPGRKIEVIDATGAGDSFWSGFLTATLDGKDLRTCAEAASNMAVLKLTTNGSLPAFVDKNVVLYGK
jgi:sugar/nucleoside kinase (ribokinase family)